MHQAAALYITYASTMHGLRVPNVQRSSELRDAVGLSGTVRYLSDGFGRLRDPRAPYLRYKLCAVVRGRLVLHPLESACAVPVHEDLHLRRISKGVDGGIWSFGSARAQVIYEQVP